MIEIDFFVERKRKEKAIMEKEELASYFEFLDELRESGVTNMFGACPYIIKHFNISMDKASAVLGKWMNTFDDNKSALERAELCTA
jgi:hypothetical protein